jgi:MoxR-like ATPase/predicted RNA-binding protein with PUA-like domain
MLKHLKNKYFGGTDIINQFEECYSHIFTEEDIEEHSSKGIKWKVKVGTVLDSLKNKGFITTDDKEKIPASVNAEFQGDFRRFRLRKRTPKFFKKFDHDLYLDWELYKENDSPVTVKDQKKLFWIFQSNPEKYDLESAIKNLDKDTFTVRQYSDQIKAEDEVIFWVSGGSSAGIVGYGKVVTNPKIEKINPNAEKYMSESDLENEENRVWVSYHAIPNKILKSEFLELLNSYDFEADSVSILKQPRGTNFPLDSEIYELILANLNPKIEFAIENLSINQLFFTDSQLALLEKRIINALKAGKSIIFIGPPGSGKSKLAELICTNYYCLKNFSMCTATSDWSTFETIGGYQINEDDGKLEFVAGLFLKCFKDENENDQNRWLIIDEINRADIDKAFGSLFSALAGDNINLPYKKDKKMLRLIGNKRKISSPKSREFIDYIIPDDWRIIATMNSFDKTSLYEMSYAFMRRFAFIPVQIPREEDINAELIAKYIGVWESDDYPFEIKDKDDVLKNIAELWNHINQFRKIGPALIEDICKFVNEVYNPNDEKQSLDWVSPIIMYVLPQFEGLLEEDLISFYENMPTNPDIGDQKAELHSYMEEFFGIKISEQKASQ